MANAVATLLLNFTTMEIFNFEAALASSTKKVQVQTPVLLFEEEGIHFAYLPSFRLTGYDNSSKGALKSLKIVMEKYFTVTMQEGTLMKDLEKCGWKINETGQLVAPDFSTLLKIDDEVKDIVLNKIAYSKQPASITLPAFV